MNCLYAPLGVLSLVVKSTRGLGIMKKYKVTYFQQNLVGYGKATSIIEAPDSIIDLGSLRVYFETHIIENNHDIRVSMISWERINPSLKSLHLVKDHS